MPGALFRHHSSMSYLLFPSFPVIDRHVLYQLSLYMNRFPVKLVKVKKAFR